VRTTWWWCGTQQGENRGLVSHLQLVCDTQHFVQAFRVGDILYAAHQIETYTVSVGRVNVGGAYKATESATFHEQINLYTNKSGEERPTAQLSFTFTFTFTRLG
jgi:hypothetical protein